MPVNQTRLYQELEKHSMLNVFKRLTTNPSPSGPNDDYVTVAASGVHEILLDLSTTRMVRLMIAVKRPGGTSVSSGLTLSILGGMGPGNAAGDPATLYASLHPNLVDQPPIADQDPNTPADGTSHRTMLTIEAMYHGRFPKLHFKNDDAAQPMQLLVWSEAF